MNRRAFTVSEYLLGFGLLAIVCAAAVMMIGVDLNTLKSFL